MRQAPAEESGQHLSALDLDALALGNEDPRTRGHLASCATCQSQAETASSLRDHFERNVFARTLPAVTARRRSRWTWLWLAAPVLAATAVLLYVTARNGDEPELGVKGTAAWQVFANRDGKTFQVHDGVKLAAGDRIRFVMTPNGSPYLLIASVDGSGAASIYYPFDGAESARIEGARVELPGSVVLDAAHGPERVFAIFSNEPLSADSVKQRLQAIGARGADAIRSSPRLDVPARSQLSLVFEKMTR